MEGSKGAMLGAERIRRAQVDIRSLRKAQEAQKGVNYAQPVRRQNGASATPGSCEYSGTQPSTGECVNEYVSNGCTTDYFTVDPTYVELVNGEPFPSGGHVNFQYIPLSQYTGTGSYADPDPNWTIESGGLAFDPNESQPGDIYIGQTVFPWSAGADLPAEGYCIIWVQVDQLNVHYGEGGQGPVCYCPTASRRRQLHL